MGLFFSLLTSIELHTAQFSLYIYLNRHAGELLRVVFEFL